MLNFNWSPIEVDETTEGENINVTKMVWHCICFDETGKSVNKQIMIEGNWTVPFENYTGETTISWLEDTVDKNQIESSLQQEYQSLYGA